MKVVLVDNKCGKMVFNQNIKEIFNQFFRLLIYDRYFLL